MSYVSCAVSGEKFHKLDLLGVTNSLTWPFPLCQHRSSLAVGVETRDPLIFRPYYHWVFLVLLNNQTTLEISRIFLTWKPGQGILSQWCLCLHCLLFVLDSTLYWRNTHTHTRIRAHTQTHTHRLLFHPQLLVNDVVLNHPLSQYSSIS